MRRNGKKIFCWWIWLWQGKAAKVQRILSLKIPHKLPGRQLRVYSLHLQHPTQTTRRDLMHQSHYKRMPLVSSMKAARDQVHEWALMLPLTASEFLEHPSPNIRSSLSNSGKDIKGPDNILLSRRRCSVYGRGGSRSDLADIHTQIQEKGTRPDWRNCSQPEGYRVFQQQAFSALLGVIKFGEAV
jgi:hypothetical protein